MYPLIKKTLWFLLIFSISMFAQIPKMLSYQGVLKDKGGNLLNGTNTLVFKLYDVESEGTSLWSETSSEASTRTLYYTSISEIVSHIMHLSVHYFTMIQMDVYLISMA